MLWKIQRFPVFLRFEIFFDFLFRRILPFFRESLFSWACLTRFYGLNRLAVCVAAVFSGSKKAVSAVAAAVVGVGLLCLPIESAQTQSSNPAPPTVSSVTLTSEEASDYELSSGGFTVSVRLNLGGSGWCVNIPGRGVCSIPRGSLVADCLDLQDTNKVDTAFYGLSFNFSKTFSAHVGGGYYLVDMRPLNHPESWIELWIYVNPLTGSVDAWVEDDSAGSYYSVSISVN